MEQSKIIGTGSGSVHIEAGLRSTACASRHHIDIVVYGSDDALRGSGWVTTLAGSIGDMASRSLFSQHGSRTNDIVRLTGVTLHSSDPRDVGAKVITEADTSTGVLHITAESLNGVSVQFRGIGTVIAAATNSYARHDELN